MKNFTIAGFDRNNKRVMEINYITNELTTSMMDSAMKQMQMFFVAPLRFKIFTENETSN